MEWRRRLNKMWKRSEKEWRKEGTKEERKEDRKRVGRRRWRFKEWSVARAHTQALHHTYIHAYTQTHTHTYIHTHTHTHIYIYKYTPTRIQYTHTHTHLHKLMSCLIEFKVFVCLPSLMCLSSLPLRMASYSWHCSEVRRQHTNWTYWEKESDKVEKTKYHRKKRKCKELKWRKEFRTIKRNTITRRESIRRASSEE